MIVMPSNNSGSIVRGLAEKYKGRIGWLIGPGGWREPPSTIGVALDNGAFPAWVKQQPWDKKAWIKLLRIACSKCSPKWAVVPDVVTNREATLESWHKWEPVIRSEFPSLPLALAVQDGMTPADVPESAQIIFIGGSTQWKWRSLPMWSAAFPGRVHVARVNTERLLWMAHHAGAVSCDGTGWFRGDPKQLAGLIRYLELSNSNWSDPQLQLI